MRRVLVLLGTLCLLIVGLSACGGDDGGGSTGTATVTGSFGEEPKVEIEGDYERPEVQTTVLSEGDGEPLEIGDGLFAQLLVVNAYDGETAISSWESGNKEFLQLGESLPGLSKALEGMKVGSRVVIEATAKDIFGEFGQPELFISPEDPLVIVADIGSTTLSEVTSDPKAHTKGDPKIVFEDGKPTALDFSEAGKAPSKPELITLTKGDGPALTKDSSFVMRYLGQVWGGKEPFDENYSGNLQPLSLGGLVPGFAELMPGVTVGSRVLLVLPPAQGYGEAGNEQAGIKGTDTIVFVVDVLGAAEPTKEATGDEE